MSRLDEALIFAVNAHEGAVRKGGKVPYIVHPMETVVITATMTEEDETLAAAALHDVVEDTETTIEEIREHFGDRVAEIVAAKSENKRKGIPQEETWKLRKSEMIQRLVDSDDLESKKVALADKVSNLRSIRRGVLKEGSKFWTRFHQKDPKEHHWYYRLIAEVLEPELGDFQAWKELDEMIIQVFDEK